MHIVGLAHLEYNSNIETGPFKAVFLLGISGLLKNWEVKVESAETLETIWVIAAVRESESLSHCV